MMYAVLAVIVIAVAVPLFRKVGDTVPMLLGLAAAAFDIFVLPHVPHSPVSCMARHSSCDQQTPWLIGLVFVLPLWIAVGYKMLRGDKRGQNGSRLP